MTIPYRTCALLGFTVALLSAGYFFAPAPAATSPLQTLVGAKAASAPSATSSTVAPVMPAQAEAKPVTKPVAKSVAFETGRAPVPLTPLRHTNFVAAPKGDGKDSPELMQGQTQALTAPATEDDSQARRAIEIDGYKNVRGLVKAPDGSWRGRALRGATEITVRVAANGSVSAE